MEAIKVTSSHKPPSDGSMAKEEFIRVGTTLYKIVEQPRLNGGYVKKRIVVGFPNISGGYELRNRYFKGCLAPKDITHIRQQGEQRAACYLFEGFMDYLSFLTIRVNNNPEEPRTSEQDYMVLNSVTNLSKAEQLLRPYTRIGSFLDNDQAGQRAYENLKKMFGNRLQDMSHHYKEYKDLNDYLCHRNQAKQAEKKSQVQSARRMPQPQPKKKRGFRL